MKIKKWTIMAVMALSVTFVVFGSLAFAQSHRTIMPSERFTYVEKIPGHWEYRSDYGDYVWVEGERITTEQTPRWITGYWERTGMGSRWVPGHWEGQ